VGEVKIKTSLSELGTVRANNDVYFE